MYEVELKVRADHDEVRARLDAIDAEARGRVVQVDTYYDAPHRDFAATDEALRLRAEESPDGAGTAMTYKGPLVDDESKTRKEIETDVADADAARSILEHVGFDPVATVRKERERYAIGEFLVTLDDVGGLGEFVEVETETTTDGLDAARDEAKAVLRRLDLDPADGIRESYLGLLLEADEDVQE